MQCKNTEEAKKHTYIGVNNPIVTISASIAMLLEGDLEGGLVVLETLKGISNENLRHKIGPIGFNDVLKDAIEMCHNPYITIQSKLEHVPENYHLKG